MLVVCFLCLCLVVGEVASLDPARPARGGVGVAPRRLKLAPLGSSGDGAQLPKYRVDLDQPPGVRWNDVMKDKRAAAHKTITSLFALLPEEVHTEVDKLVLHVEERLPVWAREEMQGIAAALNVTFGDILLVNFFFEITPFCTSVIARSSSTGHLYHARNLDFGFGMPSFSENLRDLAMDVEFIKGGEPAFMVTTFAGYVGAATGMRSGVFSVTVNEREMTGPLPIPNLLKGVLNLFNAILTTDAYPVTWATREALEDDASTFNSVVKMFSERSLATQIYLIIGGASEGDGVVLTRDHNSLLDAWKMDAASGEWFLVQTNYDHWLPMPIWDNRRKPAEKALSKVGADAILPSSISSNVLSLDPILNQLTVYSTIMSCAEGKYESFLRKCEGCSPI